MLISPHFSGSPGPSAPPPSLSSTSSAAPSSMATTSELFQKNGTKFTKACDLVAKFSSDKTSEADKEYLKTIMLCTIGVFTELDKMFELVKICERFSIHC